MKNKLHNRIYIVGSVASGKTTLAKKLSKSLGLPWYELDNVVHNRLPSGDVKRPPEERDKVFYGIIESKDWIVEGVIRDFFNSGFEKADVIILLDTPSYKRKYRIAKRWIYQNLKLEKSNYTPTFKMLFKMYKWSRDFDKNKGDILKTLKHYDDKTIIVKNNIELIAF